MTLLCHTQKAFFSLPSAAFQTSVPCQTGSWDVGGLLTSYPGQPSLWDNGRCQSEPHQTFPKLGRWGVPLAVGAHAPRLLLPIPRVPESQDGFGGVAREANLAPATGKVGVQVRSVRLGGWKLLLGASSPPFCYLCAWKSPRGDPGSGELNWGPSARRGPVIGAPGFL